MEVTISGYVGTTAMIDDDEWEAMSHEERREWALTQLAESHNLHDVARIAERNTDREVWA